MSFSADGIQPHFHFTTNSESEPLRPGIQILHDIFLKVLDGELPRQHPLYASICRTPGVHISDANNIADFEWHKLPPMQALQKGVVFL